MPYPLSQIDDANLTFWYNVEHNEQGVYYRVKPGAAADFPQGFWAVER
jgi:hypothetical protein